MVDKREAKTVNLIFTRYLKLKSLHLLVQELRSNRILSKRRRLKSGESVGGVHFSRSSLSYLLRNPFYVGKVSYKDELLKGEQPAIVSEDLFKAVQKILTGNLNNSQRKRATSEALLTGKIVDDRGKRMSPSHTRKRGVRYRYYITGALIDGRAELSGDVARVPAVEIENLVISAIRTRLKMSANDDEKKIARDCLKKVEVRADKLIVHVEANGHTQKLEVPWEKRRHTRRREILQPAGNGEPAARPIRSENREVLVASIARGRRWLNELLRDSRTSPKSIATRERCSVRKVNLTLSLAFLAPGLVKAAIDGTLPYGLSTTRLYGWPADWTQQYSVLGLQPQ